MAAEPVKTITIKSPSAQHVLHYRPGTSDEATIKQIFELQEYNIQRLKRAAEIFQFVAARAGTGMRPLIIDAGANIGASTIFFALAFPTATIVAIEPEKSNFALLSRNVEGLNVRCLEAGLAGAPGRLKVTDPGGGHWCYRTEPIAGDIGIPAVTVAEIYQEECRREVFPFLVKIDIEGGEGDVFHRNTAWFARTPLVIVEPHDWMLPKAGTAQSFLRCIAGQPRDFLILGENIYSIAHNLGF